MTENTTEAAEPVQDAEWTSRYRQRLRAAMEELAKQSRPIALQELQSLAAVRVPLNDYDRSVTKSGAVRAWNNLGWILTTGFEHAGWLHATADGGFRIAKPGLDVLESHPDPQDLYEACNVAYRDWDQLRKAALEVSAVDPETEVVHDTAGFTHARLATSPVVAAWR
ncbi:MAG: winged helix-turn-helix domain-containing protein, partial [Microthrixaceae bacterium]